MTLVARSLFEVVLGILCKSVSITQIEELETSETNCCFY